MASALEREMGKKLEDLYELTAAEFVELEVAPDRKIPVGRPKLRSTLLVRAPLWLLAEDLPNEFPTPNAVQCGFRHNAKLACRIHAIAKCRISACRALVCVSRLLAMLPLQ